MTDDIKRLISDSERLSAESDHLNEKMAELAAEFIRLKDIGNDLRELSYSLMAERKELSDSISAQPMIRVR
jgi:predicted nuclease with TOPRIM domain